MILTASKYSRGFPKLESPLLYFVSQLFDAEKSGLSGLSARHNNKKETFPKMNCTPVVRQYDILDNKWGAQL